VAELIRERTDVLTGKVSQETALLITNCYRDELDAWQMLCCKRKHWQIEMLNYVKDETFGEDRCTVRAGNGARVLSTFRNLAFSIYKLLNVKNIKRAVDCIKRHPVHALQLIAAIN